MGVLLFLSFAGLLTFSYRVFQGAPPAEDKVAPLLPFEEKALAPDGLHGAISQIDRAVYRVFFERGLGEKDVSFQRVTPQQRDGFVWESAELSVQCASERAARDLARALAKNSDLYGAPSTRGRILSSGAGKIVVEISRGELRTHLVSLRWGPPGPRRSHEQPKIAIVIDDLGYDRAMARALMDLDFPLSLSFLPYAPFTKEILEEARERGLETLLHLPMEPKGYPEVNPGKGALLTGMNGKEIRAALRQALERVPGVKGVNNHMGSAFSEDKEDMRLVLEYLQGRGLFYLDSRTTPQTTAGTVAEEMGFGLVSRNVFLDDDASPEAVRAQVERLLHLARHSGYAVGIGHPYQSTLDVLRGFSSRICSEYEMVAVSELTGRPGSWVTD